MSAKIEMAGRKYGRLTGVERLKSGMWMFACQCGSTKSISGSNVRRGLVKSCGCMARETSSERMTTHGRTGSPTYISWFQMHQRCTNENKEHFDRYGGRGITVCHRWDSFENFLADMGERPDGKTLDRRENSGNYEPGNCRWATKQEQSRNSSQNHILTFHGKSMPVCAWSDEVGLSSSCIIRRLLRGWSVQKTLTHPNERRPGGSAQRAI